MKLNKQVVWLVLFLLTATKALKSIEDINSKIPIWNIAHMVNSLSEVDFYLEKGANALEFDVQFGSQGNALYTHHGFPCDFYRKWWMSENIDIYLDKMRELTTPGHEKFRKELVLLFLDLKVKSLTPLALKHASESLATKLKDIYWKEGKFGAQAFLVLALPSLSQIKFVENFLQFLEEDSDSLYSEKIGFTFFGNDDIQTVHSTLKSVDATPRIWQGDGITNWFPRGYKRLRKLLKKRNEEKSSHFNKIYWWTIDRKATMREVLSLGVDAITTNFPENLSEILNEFSMHLRLANIEDDPWEKYTGNSTIPFVQSSSWLFDKLWKNEEL